MLNGAGVWTREARFGGSLYMRVDTGPLVWISTVVT